MFHLDIVDVFPMTKFVKHTNFNPFCCNINIFHRQQYMQSLNGPMMGLRVKKGCNKNHEAIIAKL